MRATSPRIWSASPPVSPVGTTSKSPPPASTTRLGEPDELIRRGERAGHQLAVERLVVQRAGRRKPNSASRNRLADVARHLGDVLGGRVLVVGAALAHHVDPQRGVRQERGDVHRVLAAVERIEVLREGLPLPLDSLVQRGAGDVLDAFHQLDEPRLLTRPHRRETDAAIAGHDRRHAMGRRRAPAPGPRWPDRRNGCGCRRTRERRPCPSRRSPRRPHPRASGPTAAMTPSVIATSPTKRGRPVPSTIVPPLILRSYMAELYCRAHDPQLAAPPAAGAAFSRAADVPMSLW